VVDHDDVAILAAPSGLNNASAAHGSYRRSSRRGPINACMHAHFLEQRMKQHAERRGEAHTIARDRCRRRFGECCSVRRIAADGNSLREQEEPIADANGDSDDEREDENQAVPDPSR
jgi:hypothetical protein